METCAPISILCRFWSEDGVWNGLAKDLPVAAFGQTFEEARRNLSDALLSHLQSASELGGTPGDNPTLAAERARFPAGGRDSAQLTTAQNTGSHEGS